MHTFRSSAELITFKGKSGDLYEWTSDLSGRIEWPPSFEGKLKPLPMSAMRRMYNSDPDKPRNIEAASWDPNWDFSVVFRPVKERIAVTDLQTP